ncbi:hypothetical protein [Bacillus marinisedimentorum]|uniref:hypothetical protein n=1 Tax=Bacillus marinisedimentorum TaxID=1821260 RepID=UPI0007DFF8DA|nr:hypothetical protein [Bacillus marinisedimentorum]
MEFSIGLIINIAIAVYLAIDAKKHGKSSILWAILGFIFGFLALGIYFIMTGRKVAGWIIVIASILWFIIGLIFGFIGLLFGALF